MPQASAQTNVNTIDDIDHLPEGTRAELIDGRIYYMAPSIRKHQEIAGELFGTIREHIRAHEGPCRPYIAPFAVSLHKDDKNYVEPDICVICDPNKLNDKGCSGAPDWIIEIVSPSSRVMDYYTKLSLYREAGVRVYWIVDPMERTILVYDMEQGAAPTIYSFDDTIRADILGGLEIDFSAIAGSSDI